MIKLENVSRTYCNGRSEVHALKNVTLEINAGEFVALMGHSGSGKSTLLSLLGFLDKPDSGTYTLLDREINNLTDDELSALRNQVCGFVFQQFHLLPRITVQQNVSLPLIYSGNEQDHEAIAARIKDVGLDHRSNHLSNELSGGEQQRVAIARSLVNNPLILFADEPTGNLDSKTEEDILSILKDLHRAGMTIIMVTHEMEIAGHAERIIYMKDGEIISDKGRSKSRKKKKIPDPSGGRQFFIDYRPVLKISGVRDFFIQAAASIFNHKMRSFLSMIGILFGVASVIAMLAIGQGAQSAMEEDLKGLGSNLLRIQPGPHRSRHVALAAGTVTRFTRRDASVLENLKEAKYVSPMVNGRVQAVHGSNNTSTSLMGVGPVYELIQSSQPTAGRFFDSMENIKREKVALLGVTVVKELFGIENPVGKTVKINRIHFRVIGVLPKKGHSFHQDKDDAIVVPLNTAMYRVLGKKYIDDIEVQVRSQKLIKGAIESIRVALSKYHPPRNGVDEFRINDMTEIRKVLSGTTRTMSMLLGIVAAISLIVGGIGIMNIMLVTVKERTREIGVRRAIGAFRRDIKIQFLIESVMLTFFGGIAGIVTGSLVSLLLSSIAGWAIEISVSAIVLSTSFSIAIGLLFGLWPAYQASLLKPVEALRYE